MKTELLEDFDGYWIEYEISWEYQGHDGIGEYEYWGSKQTDIGNPVWEIDEINILQAWDSEENEIDLDKVPELVKKWTKYIAETSEYEGE